VLGGDAADCGHFSGELKCQHENMKRFKHVTEAGSKWTTASLDKSNCCGFVPHGSGDESTALAKRLQFRCVNDGR
jgi:hypothetical protein